MTKFVVELHCETPDDWEPANRSQLLRAVVDHANVVLGADGANVARWNLKGESPQVTKGAYPLEEALSSAPPERRGVLRALVEAAKETPFGWRHYPYSKTDYLTDLWGLVENLPRPSVPSGDPADVAFATVSRTAERMIGPGWRGGGA